MLSDVSPISTCHMPVLQRVAYQQFNVLLETALPRQSSVLPITQCDSYVAQCLPPPK